MAIQALISASALRTKNGNLATLPTRERRASAEQAIEVDQGPAPDDTGERAVFGNLLGSPGEAVPRCTRQRSSNADAPHAQVGSLGERDPVPAALAGGR